MLTSIHGRLALSAVVFALVMGLWAAWDYVRGHDVSPSYWGALAIGQVLMLGQGAIGLLLALGGERPPDLLHFLYGVLVALVWPAAYIYTNARTGRSQVGLYALASFFLVGLALRAIMTG